MEYFYNATFYYTQAGVRGLLKGRADGICVIPVNRSNAQGLSDLREYVAKGAKDKGFNIDSVSGVSVDTLTCLPVKDIDTSSPEINQWFFG